MKLRCLGSGSSGNSYILEASDGILLIEAGIPIMEVKKALRFDLSKVRGCLISHRHNDHAKYVNDFLMAGIRVLALKDVFESHDIRIAAFHKEIEPKHGYIVGGFKVFTLSIAHDVPCLGFIIEHQEMGRLLFITDTMMVEYVVPRLNHIIFQAIIVILRISHGSSAGRRESSPMWQRRGLRSISTMNHIKLCL